MSFRRGRRLGVDVGKARIGLARVDPDGMLAVPVETVPRDESAVATIVRIAAEDDPLEIVVGLPLSLRGDDTPSTADARDFAALLAAAQSAPVRLVDERMSTVTAHQALRQSGRRQKESRSIVDQVAAVVILQHAVDSEKQMGRPPGSLVDTGLE